MGERDDALGIPFTIDSHDVAGTATVTLSGAFGAECKERFQKEFDAVKAGAPQRVVVDLRSLTFIDSAGLSALFQAYSELRDNGIQMLVIRGTGQVRRILDLTGAERALTIVDDPPNAL